MDFEQKCMLFTMQEPYYGILLSSMERVRSDLTPTMAVTRSGNVFRLLYNENFVKDLSVDETMVVLKHEMLHIAFNHFTLFDTLPESDNDAFLRNVAEDMEINGYLDIAVIQHLRPVRAEDRGWNKCEGSRIYYDRLNQEQENRSKQQKSENGTSENNPPQTEQRKDSSSGGNKQEQTETSGAGSSLVDDLKKTAGQIDDHSMWPDTADDESAKAQLEQAIDDLLVFAADEVEKSCGELPGALVGRIEQIRKKKRPRPVADWKRYLRRYLGNEFSERVRKSKKRESRRFPDAAGNRHQRKSRILVAIDTSGSISMPEYNEFFGQISTLTSTTNFRVVECDARIQHEYEFKGKPNQLLHGGGGTNFQPVIDMFNERRKEFEALVYFTDGEASIPKNTPSDTLWVISSKSTKKDRNRYMVNGASVVFIPPKVA